MPCHFYLSLSLLPIFIANFIFLRLSRPFVWPIMYRLSHKNSIHIPTYLAEPNLNLSTSTKIRKSTYVITNLT
jgi:hypothetical protein